MEASYLVRVRKLSLLRLDIVQTEIFLMNQSGRVVLEKAILIEGDGLIAIYSDAHFDFVCTTKNELIRRLAIKGLLLQEIVEDRNCSKCGKSMQEGFYFESDGTQYCSETCLTKVISWADYLEVYDEGNGDAYWTIWEE